MPRSKKKGEDDGTGSGGHDGEGTKEWEAVQGDIVEVLFGEEWRRAHLTMYDETAGKWRAAFEVPIEGLTETQIGIPDPSVRLVVGKQMEPPPPEPVAVVEAMAVPPVAPAAPPPAAPMVPMTVIAVPSESMEEDKPDGGIKTGTLQIGDHIEVKQEDGKFLKGEVKSKRKDGMWRVLYDSGDELHLKYPDDEREIRRLPRKTRPYECHACGKAFLRASHLSTHMRTHSGEKPHKCVHDGCGKAFAQSSNLRTHMRTHTGEKPYACVHVGCEKAFADPSALSAHKRIHTGERQHKCPECQKTFLRATHLTTHMRTHSGEKPHKCTVCPKAFAQSSNLSTHMRTHQPPGTDGKVGGLKRKRKGDEEEARDKENVAMGSVAGMVVEGAGVSAVDPVAALSAGGEMAGAAAAVLASQMPGPPPVPVHNPVPAALAALAHMAPLAPVVDGTAGGAEAPPPPPADEEVAAPV